MLGFSLGSVLARALSIFMANLVPFCLMVALIHIPTLAANGYSLDVANEFTRASASGGGDMESLFGAVGLTMICQLLLTPISTAAVTYGVLQQLRGRHAGMGDCMRVGLNRMATVLGVGLVAGIVVALGTLALCVPGIIFMCGYYVAAPAAVVERVGIVDALKRSWHLTTGAKGTIFGIVVCIGVANGVLNNMINLPFQGADSGGAFAAHVVLSGIAAVVMITFGAVTAAVAYHDLKVEREGVSSESLAHVFD